MRRYFNKVLNSVLAWAIYLMGFWGSGFALSFSLDDVLQLSESEHPLVRSISMQLNALELKKRQEERVFSSEIDFGASTHYQNWQRMTPYGKTISEVLDLGWKKTFTPGTELNITSSFAFLDQQPGSTQHLNEKSWQMGVKQPLLKNFAGNEFAINSRLRNTELSTQSLALQAEKQGIIYNIEVKYWDLIFALREKTLREESVKKAQDFLRWIKSRYANGAAEKVDIFNAETALKIRALSLQLAQDTIEESFATLKGILPSLPDISDWQPKQNDIVQKRDLKTLCLMSSTGIKLASPIYADALVSKTKALQSSINVEKIREADKPDFSAFAQYGQNGIKKEFIPTLGEATSFKHQGWAFGLVLSHTLDANLKNDAERAAMLEAQAAQTTAKFAEDNSVADWSLLVSKISRMEKNLALAQEVEELQEKKTQEELQRLRIGKSTTAQLILFEQEKLESRLQVLRILASMRKLEARSRLFVYGGS